MTFESQLDYRFGWRWLLPIVQGDQLFLMGFAEHEVEFLNHSLVGAVVTENASQATVWLINELGPACADGLNFKNLRRLFVLSSAKVAADWHCWMNNSFTIVGNYALLPPNCPRIVMPLDRKDWILQGLALHRPGRLLARIAVTFLNGCARIGLTRPIRARMLCIANKDVGIPPQGALHSRFDLTSFDAPQNFLIYLGTPDDNRKTVILPLGGAHHIILKQAGSTKARASLDNEAAALQAMNQSTLAAKVPKLFDMVKSVNCSTLHQEYRPRQNTTASRIDRAAVDFLIELSGINRSARPLADVLAQLKLMAGKESMTVEQNAYTKVRDYLDELAASGTMVCGHRSHGDFAPWNYAWTAEGFFCFDWEESKPWDLALGDLFYMVVAPAVHVTREPKPALIESNALALAMAVVKTGNLPIENVHIYWGLWLLRCMKQRPNPLYQQFLERLAASWT